MNVETCVQMPPCQSEFHILRELMAETTAIANKIDSKSHLIFTKSEGLPNVLLEKGL